MKKTSTIIIKVVLTSAAISIFSIGAMTMGAAGSSATGAWILLYLGIFTGLVSVMSVVVGGVLLLVETGVGWIKRFTAHNADVYAQGPLVRGF